MYAAKGMHHSAAKLPQWHLMQLTTPSRVPPSTNFREQQVCQAAWMTQVPEVQCVQVTVFNTGMKTYNKP